MLSRFFFHWEQQLSRRDTNRKTRPFEWGLEFVPGGKPADNPKNYLLGFAKQAVATSDSYHSYKPVSDWRLAGLLMSLLNTNDPTQLFSVNDPNIADWQNVLNGLTVYSNSAPFVMIGSPQLFDTWLVASNSPQALVIAGGIAQTAAGRSSPVFYSIGDILATPALTVQSPFLMIRVTKSATAHPLPPSFAAISGFRVAMAAPPGEAASARQTSRQASREGD